MGYSDWSLLMRIREGILEKNGGPCKDCPTRALHCHSRREGYQSYLAHRAELKEQLKRAQQADLMLLEDRNERYAKSKIITKIQNERKMKK